MSIYESRITQLRRELNSLREKGARASKTVADERGRVAQYRGQAGRSRSPDQDLRQAEQAEKRAVRGEQERASIEKQTADKERRLSDAQAALDKERERQNRDRQRRDEQRTRDLESRLGERYERFVSPIVGNPVMASTTEHAEPTSWDFFISHATPDKNGFVRPLAEALRERGARVWYDAFELSVGDSLRERIDEGLAKSRYGIVVLTQAYLAGRQWTTNELNGLFARNKRILPIWHNVSHDEVSGYSPMLADRVALVTALLSLQQVVTELMRQLDDSH